MYVRQIICIIFSLSLLFGFSGPAADEDFESQWEISCMIRNDKFNYVLPNAMRRNNIDMWIVIDHGRGTEPMLLDFGIETAYGQGIYVFYDGGGDRIERLCLGGPGSSDLTDMCGAYDKIEGKRNLRSIVHERDPKQIALNTLDPLIHGEGIHTADGLSRRFKKIDLLEVIRILDCRRDWRGLL